MILAQSTAITPQTIGLLHFAITASPKGHADTATKTLINHGTGGLRGEGVFSMYVSTCSILRLVGCNTAMTMPSRIYAGHHGYGTYWQTNESDTDTGYIRADLADEMARALAWAKLLLDVDGRFDMQGINAALSRYNETLTP